MNQPAARKQSQAAQPRRRRPVAELFSGAVLIPALLAPAAALAGSLSGTAQLASRVATPKAAVFEAVLLDAALADAPARVLGRAVLKPAGQSPFRFTIPYREAELTPWGHYTVRATLRLGERLLFTTDTFTPVLTGAPRGPLRLELVPVSREPQR